MILLGKGCFKLHNIVAKKSQRNCCDLFNSKHMKHITPPWDLKASLICGSGGGSGSGGGCSGCGCCGACRGGCCCGGGSGGGCSCGGCSGGCGRGGGGCGVGRIVRS